MRAEADEALRLIEREVRDLERALESGEPIPAASALDLPMGRIDWDERQRAIAFDLLRRLENAMGEVARRLDETAAALRLLRPTGNASRDARDPASSPLFVDMRA